MLLILLPLQALYSTLSWIGSIAYLLSSRLQPELFRCFSGYETILPTLLNRASVVVSKALLTSSASIQNSLHRGYFSIGTEAPHQKKFKQSEIYSNMIHRARLCVSRHCEVLSS